MEFDTERLDGLSPETLAAQLLGYTEPVHNGLVPPVNPAVAYERAPDGTYPGGRTYTRDQNPTTELPEALLAELEGGADALLFGSGMAAASTLFEALAPGSHVIAPRHMYWTIRAWLEGLAAAGRIRLTTIENEAVDALGNALESEGPHLVWVETPSNPMCRVTDIRRTADLAHGAGALVAADSTAATPVLCRPIDHGADLVFHSATKQLNGHGDVLAGALVTARDDQVWARVKHERAYRGAVLGPFEAWLLLRGMRTLYSRVRQSADTAMGVARAIASHPAVKEVLYPGLTSHPGHAVARAQMTGGFGAIVSFRLAGGAEAATDVRNGLRLFRDATSLGGIESLVEHRARVEGAGSPVPDDLLRLSIGLEHPDDLVGDLVQSLDEAPA